MSFLIKLNGSILFSFLSLYFLYFLFGTNSCQAQENPIRILNADSAQVEEKQLPSPKGAMIRSVIFPGWGQWYNGKKIKSVLVFLTEAGIVGASFYWNDRATNATNDLDREFYIDNRNLAYWYLGGAILLSMADAYVDAHLAGFDVSPELGITKENYKFAVNLKYNF
jgi:hypothetical protein